MIRRWLLLTSCLIAALLVPRGQTEPAKDAMGAVRRGVHALKLLQQGDGSWSAHGLGGTALAALALLESGVAVSDDSIVRAARYVRTTCPGSTHTYSISLSIAFLERLGEVDDRPVIKSLGERLIGGQQSDGGWSYDSKDNPPNGAPATRTSQFEASNADNSNTQFAILGLWIARRHGLDVELALKRVNDRFRSSFIRGQSGVAWSYRVGGSDINGPRTCCGLLGLAAYFGSIVERHLKSAPDLPTKDKGANRPDPMRDPLIREGFRYVQNEYLIEVFRTNSNPDLYFMWSVERTAMTYGLTHILGVNWYRLGVVRLLTSQHPNGLWQGKYTPDVDTSFALLFLNRANLTKDLTGLLNPKQTTELKAEGKPAETAPNESNADRLVREFLSEEPEQYTKRLEEYRDAKGVEYTEALARIISKVDAATQKTARDCLAARLSRMTANTLRDRLKDSDVELRRAACVACAMKEDKDLIGNLIAVLDDGDVWVVRAAGVALAKLTGENFGPGANATADERAKAVAAWKKWWEQARGR